MNGGATKFAGMEARSHPRRLFSEAARLAGVILQRSCQLLRQRHLAKFRNNLATGQELSAREALPQRRMRRADRDQQVLRNQVRHISNVNVCVMTAATSKNIAYM